MKKLAKTNSFSFKMLEKKEFCWVFLRIVFFLTISVEKEKFLLYTEGVWKSLQWDRFTKERLRRGGAKEVSFKEEVINNYND